MSFQGDRTHSSKKCFTLKDGGLKNSIFIGLDSEYNIMSSSRPVISEHLWNLSSNDDHLFSHILDSWSLPLIGYSYDSDCIYVNGTGASEYEFYIQLNRCGTLGGSDHQKKRDVAKNSEPTVSSI